MKSILLSFALVITSLNYVQSQVSPEQALLAKVNPHWKDISLSASEALRVNQCRTNRELIQLHLSLVTEHLTLATASLPLSSDNKQKRVAALSELTAYYQKGVFPINTKYENPTPIFVDDAGTRCAVGQLVYKSGHEEVVNTISRESNLGYVSELNQEYHELGDWAETNGFSVEELAWIQPLYSCNPGLNFGEIVHVSCHGGYDGAFLPDLSLYPFYTYDFFTLGDIYYLDDTTWIQAPYPDCLRAGLHKQNIYAYNSEQEAVDTIDYLVEILQPDSISSTYQVQGDLDSCHAYIEIEATGGTPPYEYILYNEDYDTIPNINLCAGIYWIYIKDSHQCSRYDSISLLSSGVNNPNDPILFNLFPNPTDGRLQLQTNQIYPINYTIFNILGEKAGSGRLLSIDDQINLTGQVNGTYYVVFEDASKQRSIFQQVVKL
jgi:hypothetical protein